MAKEPVLLTLFMETATLRWFLAGIRLDGNAIPLICSEPGNLSPYMGLPFDEQVSFLRHRLSGVLQRGCDRLWGREMKPCQIVFLTDGPFDPHVPELTQRVAEHFVTWMTRPPVVFYSSRPIVTPAVTPQDSPAVTPQDSAVLQCIAGELLPEYQQPLATGLPKLLAAAATTEDWEFTPTASGC